MAQLSDRLVVAEDSGGTLSVEIASTGTVMMHLDVEDCEWSVSVCRRWIRIFNNVLAEFKRRGIEEVFTLVPIDDKKERLQLMFGLTPLLEFKDGTLYRKVI